MSSLTSADHGQLEPRLEGTTLCVEPASVQTDVVGPSGEAHSSSKEVHTRLGNALQTTLSRADVRHEVQASCAGRRTTVLLSLDARYLDPATYLGFPENAYTYVVSVQVGTLTDAGNEVLEPLYGVTTSDIVSVNDIEAQLLSAIAPSLNELAQAWQQSNLVFPVQYLAFTSLALLLVGIRATLRFTL